MPRYIRSLVMDRFILIGLMVLLFWFRISKEIIYIKIDSLVVVICFTSLQQKFHEFTPSKQGRIV